MKNLWRFTREFNDPGNSVSLPSYICIAFTNPEMTRRIREQRDPVVHVIGRCCEALVVNKLAADIYSRNVPIGNDDELACLSAILGTQRDHVILLLSHPGAIAFSNVVFLALGDLSSLVIDQVPIYAHYVLQQTLGILFQALPAELNAKMRLDQTDTPEVSDGQCELVL